ncbi:MAG TPA: baseplate J/gp47 family protein [Xylella sp.]
MDNHLTAIDISKLPMPDVIRQVAADAILQEMLADLFARAPALQGLLPSDPLYTLLEVAAYRESVRRHQSNDDAKAVMAAVNHESVRPMTDHVTVQPAQITDYQVHARLHTYAGPDAAVVLSEAQRRVTAYTTEAFRLGRNIALSGLYAGLHVEGIQRVELNTPQQGLIIGRTQAARCTDITLVHGGVDE